MRRVPDQPEWRLSFRVDQYRGEMRWPLERAPTQADSDAIRLRLDAAVAGLAAEVFPDLTDSVIDGSDLGGPAPRGILGP